MIACSGLVTRENKNPCRSTMYTLYINEGMWYTTGSMTPFMLRLLDAELPLYSREANVALDRLFLLKDSCEKVSWY